MYILIRFVRETQAEQLLKGIFFIFIVLMLLQQLDFKVLGLLSETIINMGIIAIIVMFQPELRRVLEKMGRVKLVKTIAFNLENQPYNTSHRISGAIDQITQACEKLSRTATGALIVMERDTKLGEQISTGTILNALPSEELFRNIFHPNTPLHDGAVIVREGLILAAGCFLPKPQKEELISKDLGSRHRAAIGMSEVSDAIVIIVSEETGIISIAENGALRRGYDYQKLHGYLTQTIMPSAQDKPRREKRKKPYKSKVKEDDA
jgi:diadenylate cyclase